MTELEHGPLAEAAAHIAELRQRAVLIRDSLRLNEAQREQQRRILAVEMMRASGRFRALADAEDNTPAVPTVRRALAKGAQHRGSYRRL